MFITTKTAISLVLPVNRSHIEFPKKQARFRACFFYRISTNKKRGREIPASFSEPAPVFLLNGAEDEVRTRDPQLGMLNFTTDFVKLRFFQHQKWRIFFVGRKPSATIRTRKEIRAIVTDEMQSIIDHWGNLPLPDSYIFPVLKGDEDAVTICNLPRAIHKRMAMIGEQLGIGNISTNTSGTVSQPY